MKNNKQIIRQELERYHLENGEVDIIEEEEMQDPYSEAHHTLQLLEDTFGWFKLIAKGKDDREYRKVREFIMEQYIRVEEDLEKLQILGEGRTADKIRSLFHKIKPKCDIMFAYNAVSLNNYLNQRKKEGEYPGHLAYLERTLGKYTEMSNNHLREIRRQLK
ncbi:MAG: hypothetical protein AABX48_04255 [Nanoarchaeota archaeon]